ncbi:Sulfotransferase domain protein [Halomicronema hongdechloris C2206]|uniref:Sulfotransferase domain protein n=1 Tax=Halomicronema hongdechloris C2206 TaxID=1641165 RepID=A0A1Z3HH68_9CYAN|nr:sulfotransferase domain-containing protein [Halomicronema hongdechloris]ASC69625.1 Sulfotransferase domain protein [Halomicronema hongdechloris C2206]
MIDSIPLLKPLTKPVRRMVSAKIDQRIRTFTETIPISEFFDNDIFIVGYPKSGNTWFQNILAGLIYGVNPEFTPDSVIQDLIPDVHYKRYYRRYRTSMVFKSHSFPRPDYRKVIYIVRDGRDVMVSYFYYLKVLRERQGIDISFEQLLLEKDGLFQKKLWHEHVEAWLKNPYGADLILIKYEDMLHNFVGELENICKFIGFDAPRYRLEEIERQTAFNKMRSKEMKFGMNNPAWPKDKLFARRGKAGSYKDEMPIEIQKYFLQTASDSLSKLNYIV